MRIAYLSADYGIPVLGGKGGSVHIQSLVRAFARAGHDVALYCSRLGDGDVGSIPARLIEVAKPAEVSGTRGTSEREISQVSERLSKERGWMARAAAMELHVLADHARQPFDFIYERYSLWSRAGVRAAAQAGIPCITEVNAPLREEAKTYRELAATAEAAEIEREVFGLSRAVVAVSDGVAEYLRANGILRSRIHVIPNGVDVSSFDVQSPAGAAAHLCGSLPSDAVTIGFVGGLKPWHGIQELLRAFRGLAERHRSCHLLIVGDGPMRAWIDGFADGTGLADRIHVTGWVSHDDLPALLKRIDVATAPYPRIDDFYFSPLKLFEYLAAGRAIVASRIGQIDGIIRDGGNGLLVEPGSVEELTGALDRLLADAGMRDELGAAARKSAQAYDWSEIAQRITGIASQARGRGALARDELGCG